MNHKKVGLAIVTYGTNYGTYLQAFATQHVVRGLGYDTEIINIDSVKQEVSRARKKYFFAQIFNFPELKSYAHVILGIIGEKINKKYRCYIENRKDQFWEFREKNFYFSEVRNSWNELTKLCYERYSDVVVGSDQLWRPANIAGDFYTLNFVPDGVNKIAYATSFGLKDIRDNQRETAKTFLSRINHLSVREVSGAVIVWNLTGRKIPVVCDPTLLLTKEQWGNFIADKPLIQGKYILCYFLGDNKEHRVYARKLAATSGCKVVGILHMAGYMSVDKDFTDVAPTDIGPFEFLNLIRNASYVCTDSFHGCALSILFNRHLFAFRRFSQDNKMSTNDRIITLLSMLGMEDVLITGRENVADCVKIKTDYHDVEARLDVKRNDAIAYLTSAFSGDDTDI